MATHLISKGDENRSNNNKCDGHSCDRNCKITHTVLKIVCVYVFFLFSTSFHVIRFLSMFREKPKNQAINMITMYRQNALHTPMWKRRIEPSKRRKISKSEYETIAEK